MRRWQPQVDLARLSEALSDEILAASEDEVRRVYLDAGCSIAGVAKEVRTMIAAAQGDQDEADLGFLPAAALRREHVKQH